MKILGILTLLSWSLFGIPCMATTHPIENTLTWTDVPGQMNPAPDAVLRYDDHTVTVLSWGQQMSADPPVKYTGIGKYSLSISDTMRQHLAAVKEFILSHKMSGRGIGPLLLFDFQKQGTQYQGFYDFSKEPGSLTKKLYPAIEVYRQVLADGKPLISFYPSLAITQTSKGFRVELTFKNTGEEPMVLGGPATWTTNPNILPDPMVKVEGWTQQTDFSFLLTQSMLVNSKDSLRSITIPTGKSVALTFEVPYSAVVFDSDDTVKHIAQGDYTFAGDMKIDILAPGEMKGRATTPIDFVKNVQLHDQG